MERSGSATPNSMVVLERGAGGASTVVDPSSSGSRPPSGRRSRNKTPIQRSGSQMEVLPLDDERNTTESGSRGPSRSAHRPSSRSDSGQRPSSRSGSAGESPRLTQSAGSSGRRSQQGQVNSNASLDRANSFDGIASPTPGSSRPGSAKIHKQVSLTTVKRNYEMQGIPKNESWNFVPDDIGKAAPPLTNGTGHAHSNNNEQLGATGGLSHDPVGVRGVGVDGGNGDGVNVLSEKEKTEQRLKYLMEQLSMKDKELQEHEERRKSGTAAKRKDLTGKPRDPSATMTDSYYVSTGGQAEMNRDKEESSSKAPSSKPPPFLEDSREDEASKPKTDDADDDGEEDDEEDEEEEEEGPTAPIELMGEFLDAVMDEEYETADKLCKMILIYEPENPECLQFKPLIEEMLKKIWHRQLYGSSSEDESDDDEDDDDDDEEDDDDGEEDSDEDSDEEESSDSSEESDDEETEEKSGSTSVVYQNGLDAVCEHEF